MRDDADKRVFQPVQLLELLHVRLKHARPVLNPSFQHLVQLIKRLFGASTFRDTDGHSQCRDGDHGHERLKDSKVWCGLPCAAPSLRPPPEQDSSRRSSRSYSGAAASVPKASQAGPGCEGSP